MKHVKAGVLEVCYREAGPPEGPVAMLLHGFPYDTHAYDDVTALLSERGVRSVVPYLRGYGPTRFLSPETLRSGEQAALGADLLALMETLSIHSAVLAGYDWGGRAACIVAALWPQRAMGLVSCGAGYNIQNIARSIEPVDAEMEHRLWYQYYFHSERGRAGLANDRAALCRLLWRQWSPTWTFDEATFKESAAAFDNPDFVDVVIHSYRHRFGLVDGDPAVAVVEARLAAQPRIDVPSIILHGADDGVEPLAASGVAKFGRLRRRTIVENAGHNLPQEAPEQFAAAVLELLDLEHDPEN